MSYLEFDKKELINLEYSLNREIIRSNRAGSYASMTLTGCNTRKYHGLLVSPMEHLDGDKHVLLSSLDLTIVYNHDEFNLGIHKYQGDLYLPRGHKYIQDFQIDFVPQIYYRVGGVRILRESLLVQNEQQFLLKYTILESDSTLKLKFTPFLAFRNMHQLSKANMHANTKVKHIDNGIKSKLYDGYPYLHMQFSKEVEFVQVPDWYYNIEYIEEQKRGYDFKEDLFVPGYFEAEAKEGDSIIFSASTDLANPASLARKFSVESKKRIPRDSFKNCLLNSAEQFFVKKNRKTEVIAGYPWFGSWGRDTFIALPGLTLPNKDFKTFLSVIDTMVSKLKDGLFPNMGSDDDPAFNTVDASLWFFWAMQQYTIEARSYKAVWDKYGKFFKKILNAYQKGTHHNIHMLENGLIYAGVKGKALTWMDAVVGGVPVTPRIGCPVEINALWYNAVCFSLYLAKKANDETFIKKWKDYPELIEKSFVETFWDKSKAYLADYVDGDFKDWSIRPNQVIAAALKYSPLDSEQKNSIIENVKRYLLTPRGLRTLAPKNPLYKGIYQGNQDERDRAYHQGTVWPWLIEHYCEAYIQIHKHSGLTHIKKIIDDFEPCMSEHGIGTISEIYDGDPPHTPRGAISQAWSVAAVMRIIDKVEKLELE
ncbi:MAG: glycogen debranching enzyme family protein [Bacteroidales bacterium]|nr:glycogen debranching enzyme family protein [Bacteroidales bacterium]MBN2818764.1 glycogen debranching enzyme family protein [Bacteroidales bacterium]